MKITSATAFYTDNVFKPAAIVLLISVVFAACKKSGSDNPPPPAGPSGISVTGITMNQASFILKKDSTRQLTATIAPSNATNNKINWTSSNPAIASVTSNGLVTGIQEGSVNITASSDEKPAINASITITVIKNYTLYISGNGVATSAGGQPLDYKACFWNNTTMTSLNGGFDDGRWGRAITVSGNNVYVAGTTVNSSFWYVPTLWTNGQPLYLSSTSNNIMHYANSVAVAGANVYVSGYSFNNGDFNASFWRVTNNTVTPLALPLISGMPESDAFGAAVNGADVYACGSVMNNFYSLACYWKNSGTPVILSGATNYGKAMAIVAAGSDVYVAGYEGCPNIGCISSLKLWKNDMSNAVVFGNYGIADFYVTGMSVSGTDVYITGSVRTGSQKFIATLWKISGTTVTTIPLSDGTRHAFANAAATSGNDIFVAGYEDYEPGGSKPRYWRLLNGSVIEVKELKSPEYQMPIITDVARAYGIFIK